MKDLKSKVAYLQGLTAGLDIGSESKEGRVLNSIIEVLDEFAASFSKLEAAHDQMEDYLETLDEDLSCLEDELFGDDEEGKEREYLEVDCPRCSEVVCFDPGILEDDDVVEVTCPNCDEVVFINDDYFQSADEPEQLQRGRVAEDDVL